MKVFLLAVLPVFIVASCGSRQADVLTVGKIYTNLDSAIKDNEKVDSKRPLLIALVSKQVEQYQQLSWNILRDQEVILVAKRNYDLVIADENQINLPKGSAQEFADIIKKQKAIPYFVVVADAGLYPFRQFSLQTDKASIVDDLKVGIGP